MGQAKSRVKQLEKRARVGDKGEGKPIIAIVEGRGGKHYYNDTLIDKAGIEALSNQGTLVIVTTEEGFYPPQDTP